MTLGERVGLFLWHYDLYGSWDNYESAEEFITEMGYTPLEVVWDKLMEIRESEDEESAKQAQKFIDEISEMLRSYATWG